MSRYRWRSRPSRGGRVSCGRVIPREARHAQAQPDRASPRGDGARHPEATARVARAAFRKGNPLLSLRDELGAVFADAVFADAVFADAVFADADFADLLPRLGQPGLPPWRLALITLLQFREN